jgi:hypothetical protein
VEDVQWQRAFERGFALTMVGLAILFMPGRADAVFEVNTEGVNDYGGPKNLPNSIANCDGFRNQMASFAPFVLADRWVDGDVQGFEFADPQLVSGGGDSTWWDEPTVAMAYFTGHGTCDPGIAGHPCTGGTTRFCTTKSQCNTPPPGATLPGVCRRHPASLQGQCGYHTPRFIISNGPYPSWNSVNYSAGNKVAWGESPNSGAWRGAGLNGNVNLVVLDLSNGVMPDLFWQGLGNAFGGVHFIMTLMPTWGDSANTSLRGAAFGLIMRTNPATRAGVAWTTAMLNLPQTAGGPCDSTTYSTYGGGRGFNGCGCNVAMTTYHPGGSALADETVIQLQYDTLDRVAAEYYHARWTCNYDVNVYPWSFP